MPAVSIAIWSDGTRVRRWTAAPRTRTHAAQAPKIEAIAATDRPDARSSRRRLVAPSRSGVDPFALRSRASFATGVISPVRSDARRQATECRLDAVRARA